MAAAIVVAILTIAIIAGNGTAAFDARLSDIWFGGSRREPTGDIVVVDVTRAAVDAGDALHLPRAQIAKLLRIFATAGVRRTLIDLNLSGVMTPEGDADLEDAIAMLTSARVAVISSAVLTNDPRGTAHWKRTAVLERFARHAETVASDLAFDRDGQLRRFGIEGTGLNQLLSGADWLAKGTAATDLQIKRIDYGIDASHIRVIDAADLIAGRTDVRRLNGCLVVIASNAAAIGNEIPVPRFGSMRRSEITALAAESVLQGRTLKDASKFVVVPGAALLCVLMALWAARLGPLLGTGAVLGCCLCITGVAVQLQVRYGLIIPGAALISSVILGALAAIAAKLLPLVGLTTRLRTSLGASELQFTSDLDDGGEAILTFAPNGMVLSMNPAARQLFARAPLGENVHVADLGFKANELLTATRASRAGHIVAIIDGDQGTQRRLDLTVSSRQVGVDGWIGTASIRDVTEQQAQIAELRRMVVQDTLTGLVNRRGFEQALTAACASEDAATSSDTLAVLICDLDGFKGVNDTFGHQAGDVLLVEIADRLRSSVTPGTIVARLGGDEFAMLVRADRLDHAEIARLAATLAAVISAPVCVGPRVTIVGLSIGTAFYPSQGRTPESLVRVADAAMYMNKRARVEAARLPQRASALRS